MPPEGATDRYSGSCNPPRRAKRPPTSQPPPSMPPPTASKPVSILPRPTPLEPTDTLPEDSSSPPSATHQPAKRGRKPGPLSRAAREAQRRLNHSIIEKARRTKINEALAALKQLVPAEYCQPKLATGESDEEEDAEYQPAAGKSKKTGKKDEKEKDFKLEILVRTVAYMKDLVKRVDDSESSQAEPTIPPTCSHCGSSSSSRKRTRNDGDSDDEPITDRQARRPRTMGDDSHPVAPGSSLEATLIPSSRPKPTHYSLPDGPLPSISSWLPECVANERNWPHKEVNPRTPPSHLPSPPSSTRCDPVHSNQLPPSLNLGPSSTPSTASLSSMRTPEDESAASLLLQIAGGSSPSFRPVSNDTNASHGISRRLSLSTPRAGSGDVGDVYLGGDRLGSLDNRTNVRASGSKQVETPASLLGIRDLVRPSKT